MVTMGNVIIPYIFVPLYLSNKTETLCWKQSLVYSWIHKTILELFTGSKVLYIHNLNKKLELFAGSKAIYIDESIK